MKNVAGVQVCIAGVNAGRRLHMREATLVVCSPQGGLALEPQQAASPGSLEATIKAFEESRKADAGSDVPVQVRGHFVVPCGDCWALTDKVTIWCKIRRGW